MTITTRSSVSEPKKTNQGVSILQRVLWIANILFYQLSAIISGLMLWIFFKHSDLTSLTTWHVILSTFAYMPLMAYAIIVFSTDNLWTQLMSRPKKNWVHGLIILLSVLIASVGIILEIHVKRERGSEHFTTDHGILGLVSWLLCLLSVLLGCFSAYSGKLSKICPPVIIKFVHNFLGISGFTIGIACICVYLENRRYASYLTESELNWSYGLIAVTTFWSLLAAFKSCTNQLKTIIRS